MLSFFCGAIETVEIATCDKLEDLYALWTQLYLRVHLPVESRKLYLSDLLAANEVQSHYKMLCAALSATVRSFYEQQNYLTILIYLK